MSKIYVDEIRHSGGAVAAINLDSSGNVDINGNDLILDADGDTKISASTDDTMTFDTAASERMRIDSSGTLMVGGTVFAGGTSMAQIETNGTLSFGCNTTASTTRVQFFNANGFIGNISTSGSTTAYVTSSDYRLKENVTADWDATTRLKQLNPVRFNFIADADTTVDGFLAHEVQTVVPEAISGTHNEVDDDGNPVYQGIDQSKLVPLLVKTIQELEARITALENA